MPDYRRYRVPGGTYFFTVNLLERRADLLVRHIEALRQAVKRTRYLLTVAPPRRPHTAHAPSIIIVLEDGFTGAARADQRLDFLWEIRMLPRELCSLRAPLWSAIPVTCTDGISVGAISLTYQVLTSEINILPFAVRVGLLRVPAHIPSPDFSPIAKRKAVSRGIICVRSACYAQ